MSCSGFARVLNNLLPVGYLQNPEQSYICHETCIASPLRRQSTAMRISGHRTASIFRRYDIVDGDDVQQALDKQKLYRAG